jgi:predicted ArsR family transcriptional regulator
MRKKIELDVELLNRLRDKGVSHQGMAMRFGVSKNTIKRALGAPKTDPQVLTFAAKLARLVSEAPDDYCRKELNRAVAFLRSHRAPNKEVRYQKIIDSINSGAREVEEIAEDCSLSKTETLELLGELIEQGKVESRDRGGTLNRGRKMKLHYFIKRASAQPSRNFNLSFPSARRSIPASL